METTELHVTVMAAEDLKGVRKMSVYSLVWIDPTMKQSTRVHRRGGRYPEWNDELVFRLGEDVVLFPHSTITIQVVSQGKRRHKLLGTTYLPLTEIASIKAMKDDPEEYDTVQLQLTTPSGQVQGYINLSISLVDRNERLANGIPQLSHEGTEPVMGYPVGLPSNVAYYSASQFESSPHEMRPRGSPVIAVRPSSQVGSGFPVPTQPAGAVRYHPRGQEGSSPYIQAPQLYGHSVDIRSRRPRRGNTALALLGGALSGLILGDVLF